MPRPSPQDFRRTVEMPRPTSRPAARKDQGNGGDESRQSARVARASEIRCEDPATGELLGFVPNLDRGEVVARVQRARTAAEQWKTTSFKERRRVLRHLLDHILDHADELCEVIARDAGKTLENAMLGEIWPVCEKLRHTIAHGEQALLAQPVDPGLLVHKKARIEYHPLGVIGVICPWNYPLQNVMGPAIPALFSGNGVVVKVSEWTSWSAARFARIFDEVLEACGHDRDLVQIITGDGDTGRNLISSGADKIVFTGSMATGRKVVEESAKTLTPVILELGGKDPMIICEDAEIDQAVHAALAGTMLAAGQMCLGAERVYVRDEVFDVFVSKVAGIVKELRQGAPLDAPIIDIGATTMPGQIDIIEELVQDAVSKGARLVTGGKRRVTHPTRLNNAHPGHFFEPTILTGVTHHMRIANEETFGPGMTIMRVHSDEEAIERANDTVYGLGSTVFSKDIARAEKIGSQLAAGSTCINDFGLTYMAQSLPFGGVKGSGYGRLNGAEGLRACCNIKAVMSDRLPVQKPTKLYPVKAGDYERAKRSIELIYRKGLGARAKAATGLVRRFFG